MSSAADMSATATDTGRFEAFCPSCFRDQSFDRVTRLCGDCGSFLPDPEAHRLHRADPRWLRRLYWASVTLLLLMLVPLFTWLADLIDPYRTHLAQGPRDAVHSVAAAGSAWALFFLLSPEPGSADGPSKLSPRFIARAAIAIAAPATAGFVFIGLVVGPAWLLPVALTLVMIQVAAWVLHIWGAASWVEGLARRAGGHRLGDSVAAYRWGALLSMCAAGVLLLVFGFWIEPMLNRPEDSLLQLLDFALSIVAFTLGLVALLLYVWSWLLLWQFRAALGRARRQATAR
jgi:hypothetical protein